jgi:hypothetical protein
MTPVDRIGEVEEGGTIVFVRPESSCDTLDLAWIVDARGRFVGALPHDAGFSVQLPPGEHSFFVWPGLDLRDGRCPHNPIDVLTVRVGQRERQHVVVTIPKGLALACPRHAYFQMRTAAEDEVLEHLDGARLLAPDRERGQATVDEKFRANLVRARLLLSGHVTEEEEPLTWAVCKVR